MIAADTPASSSSNPIASAGPAGIPPSMHPAAAGDGPSPDVMAQLVEIGGRTMSIADFIIAQGARLVLPLSATSPDTPVPSSAPMETKEESEAAGAAAEQEPALELPAPVPPYVAASPAASPATPAPSSAPMETKEEREAAGAAAEHEPPLTLPAPEPPYMAASPAASPAAHAPSLAP